MTISQFDEWITAYLAEQRTWAELVHNSDDVSVEMIRAASTAVDHRLGGFGPLSDRELVAADRILVAVSDIVTVGREEGVDFESAVNIALHAASYWLFNSSGDDL
jgi:hypothetical protein